MDLNVTIRKPIIGIISAIAEHGELEHTYRIVDYKSLICVYEVTPFKDHLKIKILSYE